MVPLFLRLLPILLWNNLIKQYDFIPKTWLFLRNGIFFVNEFYFRTHMFPRFVFRSVAQLMSASHEKNKNIERHTADTIVSWPNPKQWVIVHTSYLMMIIRQSIYILSIITREMGKLKTYSPTYCIKDNGEDMLNLTHTLDKIYLTGIL